MVYELVCWSHIFFTVNTFQLLVVASSIILLLMAYADGFFKAFNVEGKVTEPPETAVQLDYPSIQRRQTDGISL